jgi:hypothetical protein
MRPDRNLVTVEEVVIDVAGTLFFVVVLAVVVCHLGKKGGKAVDTDAT